MGKAYPQRRGLCEVSRYGKDVQCRRLPSRIVCVRRDDKIIKGPDRVCSLHVIRILDLKRAQYTLLGVPVPEIWLEPIGGK